MHRARERLHQDRPRWRVAILDANARSRHALAQVIEGLGGAATIGAPPRLDSLDLIRHAGPDAAIVAADRAPGEDGDLPIRLASTGLTAVVLLTRHASPAVLRKAGRAGVMALLLEPVFPPQVGPTLDLAVARFRDLHRLKQALAERRVVARAKGQLMARAGLSEEEAFRWLRRRAMDTRSRIGEVAQALLERTTG
jgi:response regulator NasT